MRGRWLRFLVDQWQRMDIDFHPDGSRCHLPKLLGS
jgi:hypothetical protein